METTGNVWKEGVVSAVQKAAAWFGTPRSNEKALVKVAESKANEEQAYVLDLSRNDPAVG
jgi:hypothetical protein